MKRAAAERSRRGRGSRASVGPTSARRMASMLARPPPASSAAFNSLQPLAVGGEAAGDEQFGDQFVLGAEMIVHRREVDVGCGHDVAQRDVGKAAIGVKPLGGVEDRGPGLVRRHVMALCRREAGGCNSNSCMKLSFEGWKCQCATSREHRQACRPPTARRTACARNGLADERRRGDSAANNFKQKVRNPMDFNMSDRQQEWLDRVQSFMTQACPPRGADLSAAGRGGRALEGDPDRRGIEEEGAEPKASGTCSCRRRRMRTTNSAARD